MKKKFSVDVWDCHVTITTTTEDYLLATKRECAEYEHVTAFDGRDAIILVSMNRFKSLNSSAALRTLSHECNHASISILDAIGVDVSTENQEALAYTQDYIFAMCYEILSKNYK